MATEPQRAGPEKRDHRCVPGQNTQIAVERGRPNRFHVALEDDALRRHDGDVQCHYCFANRSAFATTSSMPPAMKNACSGKWSNSPLIKRSNDEMVSSSLICLPSMPVNCCATVNGWDMNR